MQTNEQTRQTEEPLVFKREGMKTLVVDADVIAPLFWGEIAQQDANLDEIRRSGL